MTYEQVISRLEAIEADLANLDPAEGHPAEVYFRAKRNYEEARAVEYIKTTGTVAEREAATVLRLVGNGEYKKLVVAEAAYEGYKARSRALETRASIGQSLLRSMTREAPQTGRQPQWSRQAVA